jgi:hypothetical protein
MTDENIPSASPPAGDQPSWTPPPPGATPPPPPPDSTGGIPAPAAAPAKAPGSGVTLDDPVGLVLGVVALAGVVLGLLIKSSQGSLTGKLWDTMGWTWAILAIVAAATALLPALGPLFNLPTRTAWLVAAIGAGYLALWWVLFVLPYIQLNTGFLATVGVLAAVGAVWKAKPAAPDTAVE